MKAVYLMNKEECIAEVSIALESTQRVKDICSHFYKITGELISAYC